MMKKQSFEIKNVSHDMICVYEYSTSEPRPEVPKPVGVCGMCQSNSDSP